MNIFLNTHFGQHPFFEHMWHKKICTYYFLFAPQGCMSRWVATIQDKILMNIHLHCARAIEQSIGQTTVLLTKNMCLNKLHYTWTFLECSNLFSVWQCMFFLFLLPSQHVSKNEVKKKQREQLETQKIHPPQEKKEHFQFLPLIRL